MLQAVDHVLVIYVLVRLNAVGVLKAHVEGGSRIGGALEVGGRVSLGGGVAKGGEGDFYHVSVDLYFTGAD